VTSVSLVTTGRFGSLDAAMKRRAWYQKTAAKQALLGLLGIVLFVCAWAAAASLEVVDARFLPTPFAVAQSFVELVRSGELTSSLWTTLGRVTTGFAIGGGAGLAVGFAMAMSRYAKAAIYPIFMATFPLPKIALMPLSMVYLGTGDPPIVAVVALSAFYLLPVNVMAAVTSMDRIYLDVAQDLSVGPGLRWRTLALPFALPMVLAALRSAWAISLIVVVAAEMLIGKEGIGHMIWQSSQIGTVEPVFAALVLIGMLGYGSHLIFDALARLITPWQPAP
jgi:NitT/TauT family transport system permease protein